MACCIFAAFIVSQIVAFFGWIWRLGRPAKGRASPASAWRFGEPSPVLSPSLGRLAKPAGYAIGGLVAVETMGLTAAALGVGGLSLAVFSGHDHTAMLDQVLAHICQTR